MNLTQLYMQLKRIRMVEEAIADRYSEQKMRCPTHLSIGQEAVAVGVSANLTKEDAVYSSHRAHAHYLAKGGCLNKLIAELYGKSSGCTGGYGGSMHLSDLNVSFIASTAIVGNSIPLAVGHGLHQYTSNSRNLTVSYFGDGAIEEGAFYESANFAVVKQLPVLFVCENNQYSVYSTLACRQPNKRKASDIAAAIGLTTLEVDGNDLLAVIDICKQATDSIRAGDGPFFIECHTYRHREHCGPNYDDDLGYREPAEVEKWLKRDPLLVMKSMLEQHEISLDETFLEQQIRKEINFAFNHAEASSYPIPNNEESKIYG